jgi:hypothetical protein
MKTKLNRAIPFPWKRRFDPLDSELEKSKTILSGQFLAIGSLAIMFVIYKIFGKFVPEFDLSSLWNRTDNVCESVLKYWYIFVWGIGLAILVPTTNGSISKTRQVFGYDILTSTLAGLWEEIGYRGLFIFTAIISIILMNLFLKYLIVAIIGIAIIALIIKMKNANVLRVIFLIGGAALIIYILRIDFIGNPLYWFYHKIMFPIWHFVSFGLLDPILYHKDFSFLFIIGAMSANIKFRDGHKYQGIFGYVNSWIIGYILLHAMMYYGLCVAIIIHAVYDISIGLTRFVKRVSLAST